MRDPRRWRLLPGLVLAAALAGCGTVPTAAPSPAPTRAPSPSASALESTAAPGRPSAPSSGSSSDAAPTTTSAPPTAPPKTASTYADDLALAADRLTYMRLRWYWGKAAKARCQAKGIKAEFEWCNDYYYEKTKQKGAGTMAADAKIKILDDDGQAVTASPAELDAALRQNSWPHWRVWLAGTEVVRLEQVFTP